MNIPLSAALPGLLVPLFLAMPSAAAQPGTPPSSATRLSELRPFRAQQGWGELGINQSVGRQPLSIAGRSFADGLGTHARSDIVYFLGGRFERFQAWVGVDGEMHNYKEPSVVFCVVGDGKLLFASEVMQIDTPAQQVDVSVAGVKTLRLVVTDAGDGINCDHANWAEAVLIGHPFMEAPRAPAMKDRTVRSSGLSADLSRDGSLLALEHSGKRLELLGYHSLFGMEPSGAPEITETAPSTVQYRRALSPSCVQLDRFAVTATGLRWEVEIESEDPPWTTPIETHLRVPCTPSTRIWAAWGGDSTSWSDPLEPRPFQAMTLEYGLYFTRPSGISLPIVTLLEPDLAVSVIFSPEDPAFDGELRIGEDGSLVWSRRCHRLGEGRSVRFVTDLVLHEADVRAALAALVERYRSFFEPPNPRTHEIAGHGAYSGYEGELDAEHLRKMGFSVNWKASLDFPYMGLFLPPLESKEPWNRFAGGGSGVYGPGDEGRYGQTSLAQMEAYSRRMREAGFYVLNYFNVTEFGGNLTFPAPPRRTSSAQDLWKDGNDFLYATFPNAILRNPEPRWTWGRALVMDCGDPPYRNFLLEQARRHIEKLPSSDGICIDRTDWLVQMNPLADDGLSWIDSPQRSLCQSWLSLLSRLGPLMHEAGKVIYVNPLYHRLDLMREVDGIYDEFGHEGHNLNASTFLALQKPVICWTPSEQALEPDPDAYFQRHLYMGAFVTAPFAANDHTITPSPHAEALYLAYGELFNALRGRQWVLLPRAVQMEGGTAKANVFEVPGGHVIPVVFGGATDKVTIVVRGLALGSGGAPSTLEVLHPGAATWKPQPADLSSGVIRAEVPLVRGCAMVRLEHE
ncbi:MAG: NPCBM/NEW2 domain-containing protein [Planctomycetota bacterium]